MQVCVRQLLVTGCVCAGACQAVISHWLCLCRCVSGSYQSLVVFVQVRVRQAPTPLTASAPAHSVLWASSSHRQAPAHVQNAPVTRLPWPVGPPPPTAVLMLVSTTSSPPPSCIFTLQQYLTNWFVFTVQQYLTNWFNNLHVWHAQVLLLQCTTSEERCNVCYDF